MNYDLWHESQAAGESARDVPLYPWHRTALRLLPKLDGMRVLEIGCGRGDFALALGSANPTAEITATDFSEAAIRIARSKLPSQYDNVRFETGDVTSLGYADRSFDCVVSCECLEHIPGPERMAKEVSRVLKPGGIFLITTENYFNGMILAWAKAWLTKTPFESGSGVQAHENFFLFWRVRKLLEKANLKITHEESNHFQWLLLPRFAPATFCTTRFKREVFNRLFRPFGRHFTFLGTK